MEILKINQLTGVAQVVPLNQENPFGFCDPAIQPPPKPEYMGCECSCFCPLKSRGPLLREKCDETCSMKTLRLHNFCPGQECPDEKTDEEMTTPGPSPENKDK